MCNYYNYRVFCSDIMFNVMIRLIRVFKCNNNSIVFNSFNLCYNDGLCEVISTKKCV